MEPINASERKSLKQTIIQEIKQYIIDNNLKAGDRLPAERKFMEIFGVSRSVIERSIKLSGKYRCNQSPPRARCYFK